MHLVNRIVSCSPLQQGNTWAVNASFYNVSRFILISLKGKPKNFSFLSGLPKMTFVITLRTNFYTQNFFDGGVCYFNVFNINFSNFLGFFTLLIRKCAFSMSAFIPWNRIWKCPVPFDLLMVGYLIICIAKSHGIK